MTRQMTDEELLTWIASHGTEIDDSEMADHFRRVAKRSAHVFLSYAHDAKSHKENTLVVTDRLGRDGVTARMDCDVEPHGNTTRALASERTSQVVVRDQLAQRLGSELNLGGRTRNGEAANNSGLGVAALERIYAEYGASIRRWAARIFRDEMSANDVLCEVMLRVKNRGAIFEDLKGGERSAWLYRVTLRVCLDMTRQNARARARRPVDAALAPSKTEQERSSKAVQMLDGSCEQPSVKEGMFAVLDLLRGSLQQNGDP
jgi:Sigma-70 region 2